MAKKSSKGGTDKQKYVYFFGAGKADGNGSMKALLGGKGANLAEMSRIGLPVPPGFTISTEVCTYYYDNKRTYPASLQGQIEAGVAGMEKIMGTKFGDTKGMPLLVAVRSGARDSMPGMMDTILNLGLNDQSVQALEKATNNPRFAWDCYRRFVQMYGDVVLGVQKRAGEDEDPFEAIIEELKHEHHEEGVDDSKLTVDDYKELVARFKKLVKERTGKDFPVSPWDQLKGAVGAVFGSWNNDRAIVYRRKYNIPHEWGTAVNVQAMVFGNTGDNSGSGVAFTRDPATGEKVFYGEFLINAQGEDVVAGVRTPEPVAQLKNHLPQPFAELEKVRKTLEAHFKDVQDFEFTIQEGKLFMLQTRNGKRTATAAVRFAVEMEQEKLIDWKTAIRRVPADQLEQVLAPIFDSKAIKKAKAIASGLNAGPGAASGKIYFNADRAAEAKEKSHSANVLLVRNETSPEDIRGMLASEGILTLRGGVSSHAALVARQMGKVCVCGAADKTPGMSIDYDARTLTVNGSVYKEGDYLSIDGSSGVVYEGNLPTAHSEITQALVEGNEEAKKSRHYVNFAKLMNWCSKVTRMTVRTNADSPEQVENALAFGAVGIGLTRTEHMFFEGDRIYAVREMIMATDVEGRKAALSKLLPYQREDFTGIFKALKGLPATIRLLDPPLHEFLPKADQENEIADTIKKTGLTREFILQRIHQLHEFNPMLGHRGCRLGIAYPEITEMQARAIFEAAADVQKSGVKVKPEVMIPLVGFKKELDLQVEIVHSVAKQVMSERKVKIDYQVGTMIEVPRGAITADQIAETAQFFSFGTNDLTQTALGISRDDMGAFLTPYQENEVFKKNPFATLDQNGVGELMKIAVAKGRITRPDIKLGICGEHGGDPDSVKFCHRLGLNYVSCSPYRVPIARLAAAQAALEDEAAAAEKNVRGATASKPAVTARRTGRSTASKKPATKKTSKPMAKKATKKAAKKAPAKKAATKKAAKKAAKKK